MQPEFWDNSLKQKPVGLRRIWLAFFYSMSGLKSTWRGEAAFRQEVLLAVVLIPLAFFVGQNTIEYILLVACVVFVLIVELLNSAIEATVDRIGLEEHPLSKNAKDMGSAAVLASLILTLFVWSMILLS